MSASILAPVLGPAAASVGLQVLLQPYGAATTLGKAACTCAGIIYPAYQTFKTVEQRPPSTHAANKWLVYWALYGLISAAERPLDRVLAYVPYYHAVKLLLLVWLQSPAYAGAQRVYLEALRPLLLRWQPVADDFLAALLRSLRRPELQMLGEAAHAFAARTPVLEWFVREPEGRPPAPRAFITDSAEPRR